MKLAGKTDVGRVRQDNQDDYRAGELPGDAAWLLVCDLLIMPGFYAALQFSHAAFLTGFTGVLACLKYGSSWRGWCAGVFLCVLGSMVRLDAALVCDAFWGAILLAGSLEGLRPSREKLFALSRLWLALACVLISSFSLNEYNKYAHRNVLEGCDVAAWNQARALLSDTCPIRQESAYQCEKYGVFANDIRMVRMFTNCDMDVFNTDYLDQQEEQPCNGEGPEPALAEDPAAVFLIIGHKTPCFL